MLDEKKKLAFHLRVLRYRFRPRSIPGLKVKRRASPIPIGAELRGITAMRIDGVSSEI